jgi:exopolyphosphatase / guanosine-5'-triphosphate,3'-diphosphate pyrophosphatase
MSSVRRQESGSTIGSNVAVAPQLVAVIDIGTSAIRMAIGEIVADGAIRTLETLSQAAAIGKDSFTNGSIKRATIEDCVAVLTSYREVLDSYGINSESQLRCVATSAVREADNRLAFVDRVYIATGIQVEPLDEAEVSRITFLGVQSTLLEQDFAKSRAVVVEVGGGTTEFLVVHQGQVIFSQAYTLGSLRLRESLESLRVPAGKERQLMESHVERYIGQALQSLRSDDDTPIELIALGGDLRFAASQLVPDHIEDSISTIQTARFSEFVDKIFPLTMDELVQDYHLTYPDAETLAPALLTILRIARGLKAKRIRVSDVNLRDGLFQDIANQGVWIENFEVQVVNAAIDLGRKYSFDEAHASHVATLCEVLFESLQSLHRLDERYTVILKLAAYLHEIGMYVGISSYHKHTYYLIQNSELFGLSNRNSLMVALVARYHRRASPKPAHSAFSSLSREDRVVVTKLASILRIADALDRSYSQRIRELDCQIQKGRFVIAIRGTEDLSLEQIALKETVTLFEETFGLPVLLRRSQN